MKNEVQAKHNKEFYKFRHKKIVKMKVKMISRNPDEYVRETKHEHHKSKFGETERKREFVY